MPNGRCRLHGGTSTGPRTAEGAGAVSHGELEARRLFGGGPGRAAQGPRTAALERAGDPSAAGWGGAGESLAPCRRRRVAGRARCPHSCRAAAAAKRRSVQGHCLTANAGRPIADSGKLPVKDVQSRRQRLG
jgi:hypothetical protein